MTDAAYKKLCAEADARIAARKRGESPDAALAKAIAACVAAGRWTLR